MSAQQDPSLNRSGMSTVIDFATLISVMRICGLVVDASALPSLPEGVAVQSVGIGASGAPGDSPRPAGGAQHSPAVEALQNVGPMVVMSHSVIVDSDTRPLAYICGACYGFNRLSVRPPGSNWYAVTVGYQPGVYENPEVATEQVKGVSGGINRRFNTQEEAQHFFDNAQVVAVPRPRFD